MKKEKKLEVCALCDKEAYLKLSHVIGKSLFREINKNSQKHYGILLDPNTSILKKSTDQWSTKLLCGECEDLLNRKYENYSLNVLKNKQNGVVYKDKYYSLVIVNVDQNRLAMYLISIFWRAVVSSHNTFDNLSISSKMSEDLKKYILNSTNINQTYYSVKISRLIDGQNIYGQEIMRSTITNIIPRITDGIKSYIFIFYGYLFEIFIDPLATYHRRSAGFIISNKKVLTVPNLDVRRVPEIVATHKASKKLYESKKDDLN